MTEPVSLDAWRTALFVGLLQDTSEVRVIGTDGLVALELLAAINDLCASGWLTTSACTTPGLAYELNDLGAGWYRGFNDRLHVSFLN